MTSPEDGVKVETSCNYISKQYVNRVVLTSPCPVLELLFLGRAVTILTELYRVLTERYK